jgi:hemolysin activation/secretion protein
MKSISEDAMTNEIQFMIEMRQFPLYAGLPNLQTSIFLQDDLDDRFTHNDYIDLFKFNVASDLGTSYIYCNHRGYMSYRVKATPDNFVGAANIYGHYFHQTIAGVLNVSGSSSGLDISVTPTFIRDEMNNTAVSFRVDN